MFIKATSSLGVRPQLGSFSFIEESSYSKCYTKRLKLEKKKLNMLQGFTKSLLKFVLK